MDVRGLEGRFRISGALREAKPYGSGHINDTYLADYGAGGRFIHQRINKRIFKDPAALMGNVERVLAHMEAKRAPALTLVPAADGRAYHVDGDGDFWRTYVFIERGRTFDVAQGPAHAFEAAKAFGQFQRQLADLPPPRLSDTIPDFHHTPKRFAALERAAAADCAGRAAAARREVDFALSRKEMTRVLQDALEGGDIPERVTHNDTKINNVIVDERTHEGVCVIDLDTVMPGLALHDFGDMVRTTTSAAAEDERDLSKVGLRLPLFEALVAGYVSMAPLTPRERELLVFAGKLITFEIGLRFLTDFLSGDVYFKVHREGHNLDRCRTQFKLIESIKAQEKAMNEIVEAACS
jgi:Ser/Thr protein kinase RdoA (MazF antagonist)